MNIERALRRVLPEDAAVAKMALYDLSRLKIFEALRRELREQCLDSFQLTDEQAANILKKSAVIDGFLLQLQEAAGGLNVPNGESNEE